MQFDRDVLRSSYGFRIKALASQCILDEVPSAAPTEPRLDLHRIKNAVRVRVGSERHLKVVSRRSAKGELQVNVVDVCLVYHILYRLTTGLRPRGQVHRLDAVRRPYR